jgi:SAM-dependent methyltransferase
MSEDYITDTPYTWGFYSDFGPLNLSYVAMLSGLTPVDLREPFRFLELGCGNGVSTNVYAACFPHGEFVGVDLNPEHVANATSLSTAGDLSNIAFHEASFADFLNEEVGTFDFIALHGVYSWVGPDVRRELREIVDRKLRPGGYAYISYNSMPGWAAMLPLRQIMLSYTGHMNVPTIEKVKHGLAYLKFLRENEAAYFVNNTLAHQRLDALFQYDAHYVAHEFFHKYWTCFYFEEIARDMRECGTSFAGSIPSWMNIRDLSIPQKFQGLLGTAPSRLVYETHKSFVLNEMFRRDLYVKTPVAPLEERDRAWGDVVFGPLISPDALKMKVRFPVGGVGYTGPIYGPLTELLLERAHTFAELRESPKLAPFASADLLHSLHFLCAGGQFGPLLQRLQPRPTDNSGGARLSPFNRSLLRTRLLVDGRATLASQVVGGGVTVDLMGGLALLGVDAAGPQGSVAFAHDFLKTHGQSLRVNGKAVENEEQQRALLTEGFAKFGRGSLPRLFDYGIVESPAPA